jgi:hypothetical protein
MSSNSAAYGQYVGNGQQPTQSQLEECEQLGISENQCSESVILAKKRLLAAQAVPAQAAQPIILTATSIGDIDENAYDAEIAWTLADLGQPNKFHVEMFDANQLEPRSPKPVTYDIKIYKGDKYLLPLEPMGNNAQLNEDFSQDFTFVFLQEGSYVLAIEEIEHEGENIRIPIQVTPEFPLGIFVVIAGLFASIIAITRVSLLHP